MFIPFKFTEDMGIYGGIGYVVGAFTPSVGRAIKSFFVKEATQVKLAVEAEAAKEVTVVEADAKKL